MNLRFTANLLNQPLATARLDLEPLTQAHAQALFLGLQDARIYRWISALPPKSLERLGAYFQKNESRRSPDGTQLWLNWALRRQSDGAYMGMLDAETAVEPAQESSTMGYLLFPKYWNNGYATESVKAVACHLEAHGVTEQRALVTLGNEASGRVLVKAGFVRNRIIPDNDTIRGKKYDDVEYVRLGHGSQAKSHRVATGVSQG